MFVMMLRSVDEPCLYLGLGTYYMRNGTERTASQAGWVRVELKRPLIIDARRAKRLVEKYQTRGTDALKIKDGAWRLSDDVWRMGHDGIIAIAGTAKNRQLTLVALDCAAMALAPDAMKHKQQRHAA